MIHNSMTHTGRPVEFVVAVSNQDLFAADARGCTQIKVAARFICVHPRASAANFLYLTRTKRSPIL
jgi:hypothetical protein